MADIRNTIWLDDKVSSVLNNIERNTNRVIQSFSRLDDTLSVNSVDASLERTGQSILRMSGYFSQTTHEVGLLTAEVNGLEKALDSAANSAERIHSALAGTGGRSGGSSSGNSDIPGAGQNGSYGVVTGLVTGSNLFLLNIQAAVNLLERAAKVISGIMSTVDTSRSMAARLELFGPEGTNGELEYQRLFALANETRSDIGQTSNIVSRTLVSNIFAGEDALENSYVLAGLINKSLVSSGATVTQSASAVEQLMQGLGAGRLYWQDLRIILQQAPGLAADLVTGLNAALDWDITTGDLKQLASDGELTAERIVQAFWAAGDEINARFAEFPVLWSQNTSRMSNFFDLFITKLGQTDGPLTRLNDRFTNFLDLLESDRGIQAMENLALAFSLLADVVGLVAEGIANSILFIVEHVEILIAILVVAFAALARIAYPVIASFIAASWPILLVIGLIALLIYAFIQAGATVGEILGAIIGGVLFLGYIIWDLVAIVIAVVAAIIAVVWDFLVILLEGIVIIIGAIIQSILFILVPVINVLGVILKAIISVGSLIVEVFLAVVLGVVYLFQGLAVAVLSILNVLAKAIDFVFGTSLSEGVQGWIDGVNNLATDVENGLYDAMGGVLDYNVELWQNGWLGFEDVNYIDEIGDIVSGINDTLVDPSEWFNSIWDTLGVNPMDGFNAGWEYGLGLGEQWENFDFASVFGEDFSDLFNDLDFNDLNIGGGDLDSVGKIKSDVNISEEDLKLLRDVAARDFLLRLSQVTPQVNVTFGDVRETADVEAIMNTVADALEEAAASSLVY